MTDAVADCILDGAGYPIDIHQNETNVDPSLHTIHRSADLEVERDQPGKQIPTSLGYSELDRPDLGAGHSIATESGLPLPKHGQNEVGKKLNKSKSRRPKLDISDREPTKSTKTPLIEPTPPSLREIMNPARLFVASLGNPPPYASTRHSAGHILVKALQSQLMLPAFQKSRVYGGGLTSMGADIGRPELTLWQSPSLMNVSGVALLKAYKAFASATQMSPTDPLPGLVVIYDEMETAPSQLRLRRGATSAKGHNGLKSVQQSLQAAGLLNKLGDRYIKVGIGIGRPAGGSRSSDDVSKYVLGQLTSAERQAIDSKVDDLVRMLDTEVIRLSV